MSKNGHLLLGNAEHKITSPFAHRINPITKKPEEHNGVDYATFGKKVPCYCPFDNAKVLRVGVDRFGANFVYIGFSNQKCVGLYYHLDSVSVKNNQPLAAGNQVGIVGTTGQSTGVHLHFSWIQWNEQALQYYNAKYMDFEAQTF